MRHMLERAYARQRQISWEQELRRMRMKWVADGLVVILGIIVLLIFILG